MSVCEGPEDQLTILQCRWVERLLTDPDHSLVDLNILEDKQIAFVVFWILQAETWN